MLSLAFPLPGISCLQQGGGAEETTIKLKLLLFFGFKRQSCGLKALGDGGMGTAAFRSSTAATETSP